MNHHFFAYVSRLRYIRRWGLMRSVMPENDAEHSLQVAMIAHAIAIMGRDRYGRQVDPEHVLALGVYHDVSEVITGDMPTPVKYQTDELRRSYKDVERMANERLLSMLPEGLRPAYVPYLSAPADYDRRFSRRRTPSAPTSSAWRKSAPATVSLMRQGSPSRRRWIRSGCRRCRTSSANSSRPLNCPWTS